MRTDYKKILSLFLAVSTCPFAAQADERAVDELLGLYGSEELISIATGYRQPVSKAPAVASIISREDILRVGATDIDQVLELVPGLHVSRNHQGYNPIYTFRGIYSDFNPQVLMLINGIPITNLFTSNRSNTWFGMPVEAIQRIEVMRGPGSAIYGADAFAGVINIITRSGENLSGVEMGARHGTYDTSQAFVTWGKEWDDASLGLIVEAGTTNGQAELIEADAQSRLDTITGTDASLAPGPVNLQRDTLDVRLDYRSGRFTLRAGYQGRFNAGNGAGVVQALDTSNEFKSQRINADISYTIPELLPDLSATFGASVLEVRQEVEEDLVLYPPGSTGPFLNEGGEPEFGIFQRGVIGNPEVFERNTRANASFHYSGLQRHDLSLGMGYYYGDLYRVTEEKNYCADQASCNFILPGSDLTDVSDTAFVFLREGDRENHYIYFQDIVDIANDWELTAGLRYDQYSDFGDTLNPRLALVWSTTSRLTTKFLYGEAFRAPSFTETRNINNPAALGNPDLDPETLRSFEVAFDYHPNYQLNTSANFFYYEWDDIIQFVSDPSGGTATAQNAGKQVGYGLETEVSWTLTPDFKLRANYAWQRSTNETTDQETANAPGQQLYVGADWEPAANYHFHVQANWVMDREREASDPRGAIDDYVRVDLSLRRRELLDHLDLALHVVNLFDAEAREPSPNGSPTPAIPHDLPLSGRRIIGEVRYHF